MLNRRVDKDKRTTFHRFTAFGATTSLVGLGDGGNDEDDSSGLSDARGAIVSHVASAPGVYSPKVRDGLQLGTDGTQYHLQNLIGDGILEVNHDGDYKRFFLAGRFSELKQVTLGYLRRDTPHEMFAHLLRDPATMGSELATRLGVSRVMVSTCTKEPNAMALLSREDGYTIRSPETVVMLLIHCADSFGSDAAAFADDAADSIRFDP